MTVKDWALEDRPREKMMANGEESLTGFAIGLFSIVSNYIKFTFSTL